MTGLARVRRSVPLFVWSLFLAAGACGCGAKTGTIKGKATVDGKPAIGAMVEFSAGENKSAVAVVGDDGAYEAKDVPLGPVKVCLRGGQPMPYIGGGPKPKDAPPPPASIPKRYTRLDTSGLTLTVHSGSNDFNIEMTSK